MLQKKHALIIGVAGIMFLLLGFVSISLSAEVDSAPYLRMGAGARSIGMGSAFTAVADDATSTLLNPGGLTNVKDDYSLVLFASKMSLDRKHSLIAGTVNLKDAGTLGCAVVNAGTGGITSYDSNGNPGEVFDASDLAIAVSYGYGIKGVGSTDSALENISFGGGVKILTSSFEAEGFERKTGLGGFDVGLCANGLSGKLNYGLALSNFGGNVAPALNVGAAYKLTVNNEHQAIASLDVRKELVTLSEDENTLGIRIGAECWYKNTLAVRAGAQPVGSRNSLYAGFGVRIANIQVDYALATESAVYQLDDSNMHYISISYGHNVSK